MKVLATVKKFQKYVKLQGHQVKQKLFSKLDMSL